MQEAIVCAQAAANMDEVPVGAVLIDAHGRIVAACGNNCVSALDPVGHAEIRTLREAARRVGNYRFPGMTMYVTLEPCAMCAAALVHARVKRVVYGATDPKAGALHSRYTIGTDGKLNHVFSVTSGVMARECGALLTNFFRKRR